MLLLLLGERRACVRPGRACSSSNSTVMRMMLFVKVRGSLVTGGGGRGQGEELATASAPLPGAQQRHLKAPECVCRGGGQRR